MLFPDVKEDIRQKLKAEYDAYQVGDKKLGYDEVQISLIRQILSLQTVFSEKSRAPEPQINTTFGKEAI
jgi:hypothetical protein